jgi:hypothetical protein
MGRSGGLATMRKLVADLADYPNWTTEALPPYPAAALAAAVPSRNAMQLAHSGYEGLVGFARHGDDAADRAELSRHALRIVAVTIAWDAQAPSADQSARAIPPRELWLSTTAEVRTIAQELAAMGACSPAGDYGGALHRLEAACTRCHNACSPKPQGTLRTKYDFGGPPLQRDGR